MPAAKKKSTPTVQKPFIVSHTPLVLSALAVVLIVVFAGLWWTKVYTSPHRVFDGMLANNLSTVSVTRESSIQGNSSYNKIEQLNFSAPRGVQTLVTLAEPAEGGVNKVITETIGTIDADYSRYLSISTQTKNAAGQKLDYSKVVNIWGKSEPGDGQPQYFSQSVLGLVPFANLTAEQRSNLINQLTTNKVYDVDYSNVKPKEINGKSALEFPVLVKPYEYVKSIMSLTKTIGIDMSGLDAEQYKGQPPISITITIDKRSRQVIKIVYGQQVETYSGYGLSQSINVPDKTIPASQLKQKVQEVQ